MSAGSVGSAATARLSGESMDAMKRKNDGEPCVVFLWHAHNQHEGIWLKPVSEEDLLTWQGLVLGPALSPYAFGFFSFSIKVFEQRRHVDNFG